MILDQLKRIFNLSMPIEEKMTLARKEVERIEISEQELERQRLIVLHNRYRDTLDIPGEGKGFFSPEEKIELDVAHTNKLIWDSPFKSITITQLRPITDANRVPIAYIRLGDVTSPLYKVRKGYIKGNFEKIYLTNTAQATAYFKFVISTSDLAEYRMIGESEETLEEIIGLKGFPQKSLNEIWDLLSVLQKEANSTIIYNVTMTLADTEYSQVILNNTKIIKATLTDLSTFRYAWVTGKVAAPTSPYGVRPANTPLEYNGVLLTGKTLYFASPGAGKVMMIECLV